MEEDEISDSISEARCNLFLGPTITNAQKYTCNIPKFTKMLFFGTKCDQVYTIRTKNNLEYYLMDARSFVTEKYKKKFYFHEQEAKMTGRSD
jgi:hypothetical protein